MVLQAFRMLQIRLLQRHSQLYAYNGLNNEFETDLVVLIEVEGLIDLYPGRLAGTR